MLINNGWDYTYNPLKSTLLIIAGFMLRQQLYLKEQAQQQGYLRGVLPKGRLHAAYVLLTFSVVISDYCSQSKECRTIGELSAIVNENHAHSFGALIRNYTIIPEIYRESGAFLGTRFHELWMMPKLITSDEDFKRRNHWILDYIAHSMADDLNHNQPGIMIVDISPDVFATHNKSANLLSMLTPYPDFALAWRHYQYLRTIENCPALKILSECRFSIFRRLADTEGAL